jgi:ABC-type multidrug transport system permease subunit
VLTGVLERLDGMVAVVRRDVRRAASYRYALVAAVASEFISMVLFYYVSRLVHVAPFATPDDYFAFVVVGLIALQLANAILYYPLYLLSIDLSSATFERLVVSPLGARAGLVATLVFPFAAALGASAGSLLLAVLVFGVSLSWPSLLFALPAAILVGCAFAPLGILMLGATVVAKQAYSLAGWLVTALSLLAGLYFPIAVLPDAVRWASDLQPLTPAVDLMRHTLLGTPLADPLGQVLLKLAGFAAVLLPPSLWLLGRALAVGRRRGTIIEA